ncbi:synaptic vesicle glycoprotein 2C-like [Colias croceus]|uniref:synaptic vesicle glycoprotein 2C-like n=1 Tax=Colias crocea TaxID=72248 RepID=UPI001E27C3AF|nr:synaptic vesicle glycoprotein 2C-like [Colias croceus]
MTVSLPVDSENNENEGTQDDSMLVLEDALKICKFGWFHLRLLLASLCGMLATIMMTTTSSFILPIAECDLDMDNMMKGWLNAIPFLGQIGASVFIGFLVDTFGRRIFLLSGHFGVFLCGLLEGSSQTYWMLIVVKFLQGIAMTISYTAISTMLSEFIHKEIRDRILLLLGSFMSLSLIVVALMSWAILPQTQLYFVIWKGYFELHSWNIYLYVCSLWSLFAFLLYYSLPESPKFLLSEGRDKEALEVLKTMYHVNTGKDKDDFPIKTLQRGKLHEPKAKLGIKKQIVRSLFEVKDSFDKRNIYNLVLISSMTFVCLSTYTCLRLWYPQISTTIEHYHKDHGEFGQFCDMINWKNSVKPQIESNTTCVPQVSGTETYVNAIILGVTSLIFSGASSFVVQCLGHRLLIFLIQISCAAASSGLYFTSSSIEIALLISVTCALVQTSSILQGNILVRVFPTKLRALAFSIVMIVGRTGSLLGNVLFPVLLEMGCMAPFLTLSIACLCQASVVYFLPDPNKQNKGTGDK